MQLLLRNRFAPITSTIGLIEVPIAIAVDFFQSWTTSHVANRGVLVNARRIEGTLSEMLSALQPLTSYEERRYLFVPTAAGWTAYFSNGKLGTDTSCISYIAEQLGCHSISTTVVPPTKGGRGPYEATVFALHGPEPSTFLNAQRTIAAVDDGGNWRFEQFGTPLPSEDPRWYTKRKVRDRFRFENLCTVLESFRLRPFDEDFYGRYGTLVELVGPTFPQVEEFQLDQIRAASGIVDPD